MKHITVIAAIGITFFLSGCSRTDQASDTESSDNTPATQQDVVRGLRCTLSADRSIVAPDETVTLTFRLHNETDEAIHFVFAQGGFAPWGSAAPVLTDPNGEGVSLSWPIPAFVGAQRHVLSVIVIPPHGDWETGIPLRPSYEPMLNRWSPGTYVCRVRFEARSPGEWLAGEGLDYRFTPIGLEAIRAAGDEPFWAGELVSAPIQFTCSTSQACDTESSDNTPAPQQEVVRGLRCTLSADRSIVAPDETVTLTFRLHNETDEVIRFVFAQGRHDPWGSAVPILTDSNGQEVGLSWPIPRYVGAGRKVLSIIVVLPHGGWETIIGLHPGYADTAAHGWPPGTYRCRVRFEARPPDEWLEMARDPRLTPIGLEAIRAAGDKPFWAGELLSEPIEFTCR